ncbi:mannonate dehydratase [Halorarum salinum]|uniref:mannonate dehydratase n=1 Tax=Halorarum salinum TaxID=2743089 RepID=A0A7D5QCY6_9EURY|nr:mannonate dehydratase [Halobaculum salinum]QLG61741.1 mannonate dehydratase [Halobaculum salinum]
MDRESLPPRVGFRTNTLSDERLRYVRQLGVSDVFVNPVEPGGGTGGDVFDDESDRTDTDRRLPLGPDEVPSVAYLRSLREACEAHDVRLAGIHTLGYNSYGDVKFGREGRDDQVAAIAELIENMGEAGLPVLGYQWNPRGVVPMRTGTTRLRGDARGTDFDLDAVEGASDPALDRECSEAELWDNYEAFLEEILPVAERAGVTLALHPIDPPTIESLGGIPRLFRNVESFRRAMETVPSDNHGLKLCLGCFSEMGVDVADVVREFGETDDVVFVHFRDVEGTAESFNETFVDCGNYDEYEVMSALVDAGFDGIVIPDHVPEMHDDTDWGHRARGFTAGYLRGLLSAIRAP